MNALVNAMPINSASARLMLGKYQILTKKYPAAAIVLALLTKNAIYKSASAASPNRSDQPLEQGGSYHPGIRSIIDYPSTYLSNGLYHQQTRKPLDQGERRGTFR